MLLIQIISQCNSSRPKRDWVYAAENTCCLCCGLGAFTGWSARVRWGWLGEDILYKILHKNTSSELLPQSWALSFHMKITKCHGCKERLEKYLPGLSSTNHHGLPCKTPISEIDPFLLLLLLFSGTGAGKGLSCAPEGGTQALGAGFSPAGRCRDS